MIVTKIELTQISKFFSFLITSHFCIEIIGLRRFSGVARPPVKLLTQFAPKNEMYKKAKFEKLNKIGATAIYFVPEIEDIFGKEPLRQRPIQLTVTILHFESVFSINEPLLEV